MPPKRKKKQPLLKLQLNRAKACMIGRPAIFLEAISGWERSIPLCGEKKAL